jgi:hypothetical protein
MIVSWRYDAGEPHYMRAIGQWTDPRRPCWRCHWRWSSGQGLMVTEALRRWLIDNCTEDQYDTNYRFNSGDPYLSIEIYDESVATAFRLAWG